MIIVWLVSGLTRLDLTKPENVLLFVCIDSKPVKQKTSGTVILPPEVSVLCKKLAQSWCTASVDVAVVVADRQNGWTDQRQKVQHNFLLLSYLPYCYMLTKATVFSYLPTFLPTDRPTFPIVICWGMQQCSPTFLPTYLPTYCYMLSQAAVFAYLPTYCPYCYMLRKATVASFLLI